MTDRVVVCDIDGVLADFTYGFTQLIEERPRGGGTQQTWNFNADKGVISRAWKEVDQSTAWWKSLPLVASHSDIEELRHLAKSVRVVYMTGRQDRGNNTAGQTREWLGAAGAPYGEVILTNDKAATIKELGLTVVGFIDDHLGNVNSVADAIRPERAFIRDWPYNRSAAGPLRPRVRRVSSVGEFASLVGASL